MRLIVVVALLSAASCALALPPFPLNATVAAAQRFAATAPKPQPLPLKGVGRERYLEQIYPVVRRFQALLCRVRRWLPRGGGRDRRESKGRW